MLSTDCGESFQVSTKALSQDPSLPGARRWLTHSLHAKLQPAAPGSVRPTALALGSRSFERSSRGRGALSPFPETSVWAFLLVTIKSKEKAGAKDSNTDTQEGPRP